MCDLPKVSKSVLLSSGEKLNSFGGYVPNYRGTVFYAPSLDTIDNPALGRQLACLGRSSVMKDAYMPPNLKSGKECVPREVIPSQSGFSVAKANHNPYFVDVLKADRDQHITSYNPQQKLGSSCMIDRTSETKENYSKWAVTRREPPAYSPITGTRDSGFTHDGPNTLDGRHMDPIYAGMSPEWKTGPSLSHEDFRPPEYRTGHEIPVPLSMSASLLSGFNRTHELNPCFSRGYGRPNPCANPFETTYTIDYPWKNTNCFVPGQELSGKGFVAFAPKNVNLFEGRGCYLTETKDRFVDPTNIGRARGGHLQGAVNNNLPSAFSRSTTLHSNNWIDPCRSRDEIPSDAPPQRYNPFPRFWMKHKSQLYKNYRPHPVTEPIDYQMSLVQPGTGYESEPTPI